MKAIIIGGSSGIGKETAKTLLQRNVKVVLVANDKTKLEKTKKELEAYGTVDTESVNLYDQDQVDGFIEKNKK